VAPPNNKSENYLAHLKGQSLLKKRQKRHQNRPINSNTKPAQSISTRMNGLRVWQKNQKQLTKNRHTKTTFFAPTAGMHCTIFPKLCMVIQHVETIKSCRSLFNPTYSFSYRVHGKIRPKWLTRGFSVITP